MNRETTNKLRFLFEDAIPPMLRDSRFFRWTARLAWGEHIDRLVDFRERAPFLTPAEYAGLYRDHPRVHEGTDNSAGCIAEIVRSIVGSSVCDVGCGTGALLKHIRAGHPSLDRLTGVDFVIDDASRIEGIEYVPARIEALPFPDNEFDTVICTHVIEHILEYREAIAELRRVARRRLIIVVPREREYRYTFNPHFNFFPYTHSFLRAVHPVPDVYVCKDIGRDIFYSEDRPADA